MALAAYRDIEQTLGAKLPLRTPVLAGRSVQPGHSDRPLCARQSMTQQWRRWLVSKTASETACTFLLGWMSEKIIVPIGELGFV